MKNAVRSELLKLRSVPGTWVVFFLAIPLTVFGILITFGMAGNGTGHAFAAVYTQNQRRELLGAGYAALQFLAPILGVLCITTEYRNKTMTTTLVLTPRRSLVIGSKVVVTICWSILMAILGLLTVLAVGLPWNSGMGGVAGRVLDQFGAVAPGYLAAAVLLGLFGLGFGTLVKNQAGSAAGPPSPCSPGGRAAWSCWAGGWSHCSSATSPPCGATSPDAQMVRRSKSSGT
jgi:ABC-2 type transport system permease protein